ncbi:MAG: tetratricopeptide repeat protein, partial [Bacteroidetes bacterium]|nr:tetratricopeptide repeat protein [Bacteroidota bacterium]
AMGKYYQDIQNWDKAMEAYNVLLKIDAKNKFANFNLGAINFGGKKDYKTAIQFFTNALTIDAAYVDAYYGRGMCYQTMGDKKNALADFQACLSIDPKYEAASVAMKQIK